MYRHHLTFLHLGGLILFLLLCGCNRSKPSAANVNKATALAAVTSSDGCSAESAVRALTKLEEIKAQEKVLNSLFGKDTHISYMVDSTSFNNKDVYAVTAGYNNEERYETYYHFYVDKSDCKQILIMDVVDGDYLSPEEWRARRN